VVHVLFDVIAVFGRQKGLTLVGASFLVVFFVFFQINHSCDPNIGRVWLNGGISVIGTCQERTVRF
jgi:hypothetical protein